MTMRQRALSATHPLPLFDAAATRRIEQKAAAQLPPHTLMARAGRSVADLARAVAPHARTIWVACGPGNNGGDGLAAAALLQPWMAACGGRLIVTLHADPARLPTDAQWALAQAQAAGVAFAPQPPEACDLVIDALLGLGAQQRPDTADDPHDLRRAIRQMRSASHVLLCVDTPSDLNPFSGLITIAENNRQTSGKAVFCLTFLTLKPGLLTHQGRDLAGDVWWDDLGTQTLSGHGTESESPIAWWMPPATQPTLPAPLHAAHKGTAGDVWVLGGQTPPGGTHMLGAAVLAGRAALHGGAGRVHVVPLNPLTAPSLDPTHPELMFRHLNLADVEGSVLPAGTWVVGCGGGEAIAPWLPCVLSSPHPLVLDADALNHLAMQPALQAQLKWRSSRGWSTVITPHPLEAARLLGCGTADVQTRRLGSAQDLADRWGCVCVLKGSGTVVAAPGLTPIVNGSGNGRLATAGTGDVLAGLLGALLARQMGGHTSSLHPDGSPWPTAMAAAVQAVGLHGAAADAWPTTQRLTASALAQAVGTMAPTRP